MFLHGSFGKSGCAWRPASHYPARQCRQQVFFTAEDYTAYLTGLAARCRAEDVEVLVYCLMLNHVHLILVPPREDALSAVLTAAELAFEAMRIHGGNGYSVEYPIERLYRDAPLLCIGEGTNEMQRIIIARQLVERSRI